MRTRFIRTLLVLALLVSGWLLVSVGPATASSGNLSNPGFETGDLSGWVKGTAVDFAGVVGADGFATPNEGTWMARLGSPHESGQPVGPNVIYQDFTVVDPGLSFAYNIFTYDYTGYNHFHYRVIDLASGSTIKSYSQGAWGAGGSLKSTGWQTVTLDLSGYVGKSVRLEIDCGGTYDQNYGTWAYVDALRPADLTTTATQSPGPNPNGWNSTDVTVSLSAVGGAEAKEIHYSVNGGPETVVAGSFASLVLSREGVHTLAYFAVDTAGNVEPSRSLTVKIDKTKPTISINSPGAGPYLTSESITVGYAVSDALSGVDAGAATLDGVPVANGQEVKLATMAGRHTFQVSVADRAGNAEARSVEFVVLIAAVVNIRPDSLSLGSQSDKSAVTAYVEFPAGYDVAQIDVSTVKLLVNGGTISAQPSPTCVGDYDGDGAADLMVKFDRQAVIEKLGGTVGEVTFEVAGRLSDGRGFEGSDVEKVVGQVKP